MAAGAWTLYNKAKKKICNGTISLAATTFHIALYQTASNAATLTLSAKGSLTNEVASGNGYSSSGKALTGEVWTVGATAITYKFDVADVVWTATGGTIPNIRYAVIYATGASGGASQLLCYAALTSTEFTLAQNNTLTIQMASGGVLTLT